VLAILKNAKSIEKSKKRVTNLGKTEGYADSSDNNHVVPNKICYCVSAVLTKSRKTFLGTTKCKLTENTNIISLLFNFVLPLSTHQKKK